MIEPRTNRNLALELLRVTEAGALAAAPLQGRGNKEAADRRAVEAIRSAMASVDMKGTVVIGEGEKDEAPMLYFGEQIGNGLEPEVDVARRDLRGRAGRARLDVHDARALHAEARRRPQGARGHRPGDARGMEPQTDRQS